MTWYVREKRTAKLIKGIYKIVRKRLTPSDIWNLCRLTWITKNQRSDEVSDAYMKSTKLPALIALLNVHAEENQEAESIRACTHFFKNAREFVHGYTGIVNLYGAARNVSKKWIAINYNKVHKIVFKASLLQSEKEAIDLRRAMISLPGIPLGPNNRKMPPSNLLSPLLACLDPRSQFPIINGHLKGFLAKIGLGAKHELSQHENLVKLIDKLHLHDSFQLDTKTSTYTPDFIKRWPVHPKIRTTC
jgi:hypothetical protein